MVTQHIEEQHSEVGINFFFLLFGVFLNDNIKILKCLNIKTTNLTGISTFRIDNLVVCSLSFSHSSMDKIYCVAMQKQLTGEHLFDSLNISKIR